MRKNILLEKENNCLKDEIKNQLFIIQTFISNENRKTQRKSWKSINPDLLDKTETPTRSNLTNRFESLDVAEENSGPENKINGVTPKYAFSNDKPKHVIVYDIYRNKASTHSLFIRNQLMMLIEDHH